MAKLAFAAFLLWAVTVAAAAFFYLNGVTRPGLDGRRALVLSEAERVLIQADMRQMLQGVSDITAAIARGDAQSVSRASGKLASSRVFSTDNAALLAKLPLDFRTSATVNLAGFEELASAARGGASSSRLTAILSRQLAGCAACHEAFRTAP
jgi:hypothetical protein